MPSFTNFTYNVGNKRANFGVTSANGGDFSNALFILFDVFSQSARVLQPHRVLQPQDPYEAALVMASRNQLVRLFKI